MGGGLQPSGEIGKIGFALFRYPQLWDTPELKKIYSVVEKVKQSRKGITERDSQIFNALYDTLKK